MRRVSKEYQKIIAALDDMKDQCSDIAALQEAMDIISDYEKVVADSNRMIKHYETPEKARRVTENFYSCPNCGKGIQFNRSHCQWCGKRIGWWK